MGERNDDSDSRDRRSFERFPTRIEVDFRSGDTFLYSYISNISEMGIFIHSTNPLPVGSPLELRFEHDGLSFELEGTVTWINPLRAAGDDINPGMGVAFRKLSLEDRDRVVRLVRTVAYLRAEDQPN